MAVVVALFAVAARGVSTPTQMLMSVDKARADDRIGTLDDGRCGGVGVITTIAANARKRGVLAAAVDEDLAVFIDGIACQDRALHQHEIRGSRGGPACLSRGRRSGRVLTGDTIALWRLNHIRVARIG